LKWKKLEKKGHPRLPSPFHQGSCDCAPFFKFTWGGWHFLKKKNQTTRHLFCLDFNQCGGQKMKFKVLSTQKSIFQPVFLPKIPIKYLRNHDKSIHCLKKPSQKPNLYKTKNQPELIYVFSRTFKEQKHLIWTPLIKKKNLT
jgi:hypothetical protein